MVKVFSFLHFPDKRIFRFALILLLFFPAKANSQLRKLSSFVNPFIGTDGFGHTFPGATMPFGMVQLSPDTRIKGWETCSGYHSSNPTIIGFSHTHLSGTGATDYGDIMFMATEQIQLMPGDENDPLSGYRSAFKKETEKARPGYYKVMLADHGIQAEMTATTRCGLQKYTFPSSDNAVIILDLVHGIEDHVIASGITIQSSTAISGFRRSTGWAKDQVVYFYAEFSMPFKESGIADKDGKLLIGSDLKNKDGLKAWMKFKIKNYESILVKVGISTVSTENAKLNLDKEMVGWDFLKIMTDATNAWDEELSRIVVEGGKKEDKINFYTSMYHAMLSPNIMSDVDGRYRGMDNQIHKMERGNMYTVFSLWDTFRALHPLFTIIDPLRAQEFVRALLQKYKESGELPVWELASNETGCMIGYHSIPVIVDAYQKQLRDFDIPLAYEAMKKSAMMDHLGMKYYKQQGYIPADKENEAVSKTLEYAYDDWCIAQMAASQKQKGDYEYFMKRSKSYLNVFDQQSGFMRGKNNSNWLQPFDPYEVSGIYTEANAWQYSWFVPHDVDGMIEMMGGVTAFTQKLDSLFTTTNKLSGRSQPDISGMIGQYAHGNEPSHHMAYLYNFTNKPWRTAELCREIARKFYTNERDGLIGNEDCGQMSAWYIFNAMGFYPVCPGNNLYELGSPLFHKITIGKANGNKFIITADSVSSTNIYIKEASLNGKTMSHKLHHMQINQGGELNLKMSANPATFKLTPPFTIPEKEMIMIPFLISGEKAFLDSCLVEMKCYTPNATIRFTNDGSEPDSTSFVYKRPFYIKNSSNFKIKAFHKGMDDSFTESVSFIKLPYRKTITYKNPYSHLYTAGGKNGLIDGLNGEPNAFGGWQGFYGEDFEAVIDLEKIRSIKKIEATFLQQYPSWIWLPTNVEFYVSSNGKDFEKVYSNENVIPLNESGSFVHPFTVNLKETSIRFVKVIAKNIKTCPEWHPGAGEKAWIFIDEVAVE